MLVFCPISGQTEFWRRTAMRLANGVADGEEKREEDGSHAVECGAIINRRTRLDNLVDYRSFREGQALTGAGESTRVGSSTRRQVPPVHAVVGV